ncbi:MAG: alpha-galactosidase [Planctomycetia bacterium]|nr:alpha-galactosidase [Planctomycetia bacterium]
MTQIIGLLTIVLGAWTITFDETNSQLTAIHENQIVVSGKLSFESNNEKWSIGLARDAVTNRIALIDPRGLVFGYITFQVNGDRLELLFHHRTRQFYSGVLSFDGEIEFRPESFACRTRPEAGEERVLVLGTGNADSFHNDTIFAREEDLAFQIQAAHLNLHSQGNGKYGVHLSGRIEQAAESTFVFNVEDNYFQRRYVPYYSPIDRKRCPSAPTGWMSWNVYFDKATAEDNLAEARIGQKYLQPFGLEFWSIESWQGNSDQLPVSQFHNVNLEVNERQFPDGMKKLADDIRALGFRPGIWMAPFGTGNDEFYQSHKNWFLHNSNGEPLGTWNGKYTLDPTNPEVHEQWRKIFHTASQDWGYEFFKIDGMSAGPGYCAHFFEDPNIRATFSDPDCPNSFESCVRTFREGIGPDRVFLACQGHVTGPEAEFADASRIGSDIVHPNTPVKWANILQQAGRTLNQIFTHNIVFFADPDTLLVNEALNIEEARTTTTIVSLPGQMMFSGDKLAELPPERMRLLQQTLPVCDIHPMNLYPYFSMLPIWDLKISRDFLCWDVVALFNWSDEEQEIRFSFDELGLDSQNEFVLYEFWTNCDFGTVQDAFSMTVPARAVRLLAVHPVQSVPQFLTSDRHITQGAVDLTDLSWDENAFALRGKVKLVAENPTTLRFRIPDHFQFLENQTESSADKLSVQWENNKKILAVKLISKESEEVDFLLLFSKKQ